MSKSALDKFKLSYEDIPNSTVIYLFKKKGK